MDELHDDVRGFDEIDRAQVALVGGKGANLGELARIEGVRVPPGCCVTTEVYERVVAHAPAVQPLLARLAAVAADDGDTVRTLSAELRRTIEQIHVPEDVASSIADALGRLGAPGAYAVRSSATAEDLPTASFAGQQDSFLHVVGVAAVIEHVRRCWASLFTERAVTYRRRLGVDDATVRMAVVVQQMAEPRVSGVLFTADPVSGNRTVSAVEATFGLGEALVSGLVDADSYRARDGVVVARTIGAKQFAAEPRPDGGTRDAPVDPVQQILPALTDTEVERLAALGRHIESHFGCPQDVEWCLVGDQFQVVQSRPITTLYPIPVGAAGDEATHVYVSVGHGQMMTDAMRPLGLSMWRLTALPPMHEAGGRLFVDVTDRLASPATREGLVQVMGTQDPLLGDALRTLLDRGDVVSLLPDDTDVPAPVTGLPNAVPPPVATDRGLVLDLIAAREASLATLRRQIATYSGPALFDFILEDIQELKRLVFEPESHQVLMAGMDAASWLNEHLREWLDETNVADTLSLAVADNVTAEMGLALLDVADVVRPHPEVVAFLHDVDADSAEVFDDVFGPLGDVEGGAVARAAIRSFLDTYGARCVGEIDITRPRWIERPATLVPVIVGNVEHFAPGEARRRVEDGTARAEAKRVEVLDRLRSLPDGEQKAAETEQMIDRVRTFAGYREYPKFVIVERHWVYKQALLAEAARLVGSGVLTAVEEAFFLTFQEFREAVRTRHVDHQLIELRQAEFRTDEALTPPRVLTSDGEVVTGSYRREDLPDGALAGLAVSSGTVEGRARVLHDMSEADLDTGDILVTPFTDPSWSPLFVSIAGLVTEVGGLMTHGAVIAREYGLPAVVGVEQATRLIRDGQRIRVHGTEGYIELLD